MDPLIVLALAMAPELARWLIGQDAQKNSADIEEAVRAATGTSDAAAAGVVLQQSTAAVSKLRLKLVQLNADYEQSQRQAELADLKASLAGAWAARAQAPDNSSQPAILAWAAPVLSAMVLVSFGLVVAIVLTRGVSVGNETAANMLLGTLAAMATSVVSYWVGSSAGSARKDERLSQVGK